MRVHPRPQSRLIHQQVFVYISSSHCGTVAVAVAAVAKPYRRQLRQFSHEWIHVISCFLGRKESRRRKVEEGGGRREGITNAF